MVPGIIARDERCRNFLRIDRGFVLSCNTRAQADAFIYLHATVSGDSNGLRKLFTSLLFGVTAAKHFANHRRDRGLMILRRKEEVRVAVFAKLFGIVGVSILVLFVFKAFVATSG